MQKPAEHSHGSGEDPEETGVSKETCVLEAKPLATPKTAEGVDNTETELVELHLPDETSTFEKILAEIQQPSHDDDGVGAPPEATDYTGHVRTTEEVVRDTLNKVGNGVVCVGRIGYKVKEIDYPQHAKSVLRWSAAHPYQTALQVGMGVLMFSPATIAGPALSAAGFSSGIIPGASLSILCWRRFADVSGSIASAQHAAIGNVAARSWFAILQSAGAGAGGYGLPIVHSVIQTGSAATSTLGLIGSAFVKGKQPVAKDTVSANSSVQQRAGNLEQGLDEEGLSDATKSAEEAKQQDSILKSTFGKSKM